MNIFMKLSSVLKRNIIPIFDKDYVQKKLSKRRGECRRCGQCCRGCPFLDVQTMLCKTYDHRPVGVCFKEFPLEEKDQRAWGVKGCGFFFDK